MLLLFFSTLTTFLILPSHSTTVPFSILHTPPPLSVTDYGATGDGVTYDTHQIQSTIDACASLATPNTLCHVIFPPGKYLTATIRLRSRVVLNVTRGAVVLGGTRMEDYPEEQERWYVVLGEGVEDVGVVGEGEINGQGGEFVQRFDEVKNVMVSWNSSGSCLGDECRPRLLGFLGCNNVTVSGVTLNQPAYWW